MVRALSGPREWTNGNRTVTHSWCGSRSLEEVHQLPNWPYLISSSQTMSQNCRHCHQRHIPLNLSSPPLFNHSQHKHITFPCLYTLMYTHTHIKTGHLLISRVSSKSSGARVSLRHLCRTHYPRTPPNTSHVGLHLLMPQTLSLM